MDTSYACLNSIIIFELFFLSNDCYIFFIQLDELLIEKEEISHKYKTSANEHKIKVRFGSCKTNFVAFDVVVNLNVFCYK